jgi:hypothetical protein
MKLPRFSICIPTKNRPAELNKWFKKHYNPKYNYIVSIEKQDIPKYEKESFLEIYNPEIIILPNNKGIGYARNKLTLASIKRKDKITMFSDDNSYFDINKVPQFINIIYKNKKIMWLGGCHRTDYFYLKLDKIKNKIVPVNRGAPIVFALRTEILKKNNFHKKLGLLEDTELAARIKKKYYPNPSIYLLKGFTINKKRHNIGGCYNFKKRKLVKKYCGIVNKSLGQEFATPSKYSLTRFSWKKFFESLR